MIEILSVMLEGVIRLVKIAIILYHLAAIFSVFIGPEDKKHWFYNYFVFGYGVVLAVGFILYLVGGGFR